MKQVAIRFKDSDSGYPWSSIEELDELAGVYYRITALFPNSTDFKKIYDVIYPEKLQAFKEKYSDYIVEFEEKEEGYGLPSRDTAPTVSVNMNDPENISGALLDAINKIVVD